MLHAKGLSWVLGAVYSMRCLAYIDTRCSNVSNVLPKPSVGSVVYDLVQVLKQNELLFT